MRTELRQWRASAGIWTGFAAWATSTQLNYAMAGALCADTPYGVPLAALVLIVVSLAGAVISVITLGQTHEELATDRPTAGTPTEMLAAAGLVLGCFFALIIFMQGAAALFLGGCGK